MRLWRLSLAAALVLLVATAAETAEVAPFALLSAAEVAGVRIGWSHDLRAAFDAAAADGLPIVLATEGDAGAFFADVLRCPTLNSMAGQAHFLLVKLPLADEASEAARLVNALHIDPAFSSTVVALRPGTYPPTEILRLRGYHDEAALVAKLAEVGLAPRRALPLQKAAIGDEPPRDCLK